MRAPPAASRSKATRIRLHFFGGKGGVGKTTCAAAHAVARARRGDRVLAVSTDPAHSLGDALRARLSARVSPVIVGRRRALQAVEIDAPRAFGRWLASHRRALGDIIAHGTWLDRDDIDALLELSMPGLDELMGMLEIMRLSAGGVYDEVVVDTAPTGHTLRLLAAPAAVDAAAGVLDELQREHRIIRNQLARVGRPDAGDRLIALLADDARQMSERLRDERAVFHWVTHAEPLAIAETLDAIGVLEQSGIRVAELIVNRLTPEGPPCPVCDRRRDAERRAVTGLARRAGGRTLRTIAAAAREPRGVAALARLEEKGTGVFRPRPWRGAPMVFSARSDGKHQRLALAALRQPRLLFFGGKGGVGKTTAAAAAAIRIARAAPASRVLLLSTDPAHSLGDVFDAPVGDAPRPVPGGPRNLEVRELDAVAALAARRAAIEASLQEISDALGSHAGLGAAAVTGLIDLAPPGIDELFGILSVVEAQSRYRTAIVDTAPTGHAVRLLEMPDTAREWVQVLLRVLLKYRALLRPGPLAAELVALSRDIRTLQDLMHDATRTRFVTVTRAANLPRLETERLLVRLRRLRIAAPIVVVNARTLAPGNCPWCQTIAAAESREVDRLSAACRRRSAGCAIIQAPLAAPPPRGVHALERWSKTWIA